MIPPPPVDWTDVAFDWWAARRAAEECDRFADLLDDVRSWNHAADAELQQTWRGGLAQEFSRAVADLARDLDARAQELRAQARSLRRTADAAEDEQHLRERQRDDWHDWDAHRRRHLAGTTT